MSSPRSSFKALLDGVAEEVGAKVYGQAPGNKSMTYPAIKYEQDSESAKYADNIPYDVTDRYLVTVIERLDTPECPVAKAVRQLPMCSFNSKYVADQLYHTVYTIFF